MTKYVKYDNIEYIMPFLFCNDIFIPLLSELLKKEKNPIKYVYGSVNCCWAGGRFSNFNINNLNEINNYLSNLKESQYTPTFTFTSIYNINEKLNDEYSNKLLDIAYSNNSSFIVASEILYNHIKSRYPNAKMHCSVISAINNKLNNKDFNETEFYNKMLDKYEIVVLRPEYVLENLDNLNNLISDISRAEILINQTCQYDCPNHINHYSIQEKIDNLQSRNTANNYNEIIDFICIKTQNSNFKSVKYAPKLVDKLISMGIKKIKLQGRTFTFDRLFEDLYKYFFNNEYSKEFIINNINTILANRLQNNKKIGLILSVSTKY